MTLERSYDLDAPKGVAGRNSDNTFIQQVLGWEPSTPLRDGMAATYAWIAEQYRRAQGRQARGRGLIQVPRPAHGTPGDLAARPIVPFGRLMRRRRRRGLTT